MLKIIGGSIYIDRLPYGNLVQVDEDIFVFELYGKSFSSDELRQIADKLDELNNG